MRLDMHGQGAVHEGLIQRVLIPGQISGGGDIELMLNQRAIIGAFPWRYDGLEACPCRIVCFKGMDESVKATGDAAKAVLGMRRGGSSPLGGHDGR